MAGVIALSIIGVVIVLGVVCFILNLIADDMENEH